MLKPLICFNLDVLERPACSILSMMYDPCETTQQHHASGHPCDAGLAENLRKELQKAAKRQGHQLGDLEHIIHLQVILAMSLETTESLFLQAFLDVVISGKTYATLLLGHHELSLCPTMSTS